MWCHCCTTPAELFERQPAACLNTLLSAAPRRSVVATACVYLRRFYVRRCLCEYDPRAVAPACLYLAAKAEEAQAQAKALFHFMKKLNASGPPLLLRCMHEQDAQGPAAFPGCCSRYCLLLVMKQPPDRAASAAHWASDCAGSLS